MKVKDITVTDALGQRFPLADCLPLHPRQGALDYGDPFAIVLPDGETIVALNSDMLIEFAGPEGHPVEWDCIDWFDGDEEAGQDEE